MRAYPSALLKRAFVASLLCFYCTAGLYAQAPAEFRSLVKGKSPAEQIVLLDSAASAERTAHPEKSYSLLRASVQVAAEAGLDSLEITQRVSLGKLFRSQGKNSEAVLCLDTAIETGKQKHLPRLQILAMNQKALALSHSGDYVNASKVFVEAIALAEAANDIQSVAITKQHWGTMFFYSNQFDNAISYTQQSLVLFRQLKDSMSIATNLDNIGLYYSNLEQNDSAYKYQLQALAFFRELGDTTRLIVSYNNMGALLTRSKNYGESEKYLNESLKMAEKKNDTYHVLTALISLGILYDESGDYQRSVEKNKRAFALADSLKDNYHKQQTAKLLGDAFFNLKNYEQSAFYFRASDDLRREIFNEEKTKAVDELSQKYESEKRQEEIRLLLAEKTAADTKLERDRLLKVVFIIITIALLLFSFIVVRRYVRKKKDNVILHEKNEAIALQKRVIEEKNGEILDSISYAKRIQNAVIPSSEKLQALFPESFIYFRPRDIISGDFYWIGEAAGGAKYLAVADCTGHGVPGALMSMLGASLLSRIFIQEALRNPGPVLDRLHESLIDALNQQVDARSVNDGMDIVLLMFDPAKRKAVIATAGRPVYYISKGKLETIAPDKISIGSSLPKASAYTETEIDLSEPVQFYLFSDGITDQFGGPLGKKFMSRRLQELILQQQSATLQERERIFAETFENWKAGFEQTDDMTLIHVSI